jgi:hypothetical protein
MDATSFELAMSVPRDQQFAVVVHDLARHAANYAGCAAADCDVFARSVGEAFTASAAAGDGDVPVVFRRNAGPLEVLLDGRLLTLAVS